MQWDDVTLTARSCTTRAHCSIVCVRGGITFYTFSAAAVIETIDVQCYHLVIMPSIDKAIIIIMLENRRVVSAPDPVRPPAARSPSETQTF